MTAHPVTYDHDAKGNIVLPPGAPFDGKPVLIKLAAGWCEAWWEDARTFQSVDGTETEGFCWVCMDGDSQAELDDAKFWTELPQEPQKDLLFCAYCDRNIADALSKLCPGCEAYREHTS